MTAAAASILLTEPMSYMVSAPGAACVASLA